MTAVEFLKAEMRHIGLDFTFDNESSVLNKIFQQALELEKQQIMNAFDSGWYDGQLIRSFQKYGTSEKYYNALTNETE